MATVAVPYETVAGFLPRIERFARTFHGWGGAEFDDLVQEGWAHVLEQYGRGARPSHTGIKNAMLDWVRYCRRRGFTSELEDGATPELREV